MSARCVALCAASVMACSNVETGLSRTEGNWCHGHADGTLCDDGDPCTRDDVCGLGVCRGRPAKEGDACDDANACTTQDRCLAGQCRGSALDCVAEPLTCAALACQPKPCACPESKLACHVAICDPATQACIETPVVNGAPCDDGERCTSGDACTSGKCAGVPRVCEGSDACHSAACSASDGECHVTQFPDGATCDDKNPCTQGETCSFGKCGGAAPLPEGTVCDDHDLCTASSSCHGGQCTGDTPSCASLTVGCLVGVCDPASGACVTEPAPAGAACKTACVASGVCTDGECVGTNTCQCQGQADGTACDDGSACTTGDVCQTEACSGTAKDCTAKDDACHVGACDPGTGACVSNARPAGTACDDGDACTVADGCVFGECHGAPKDCSSLSAGCKFGACVPGSGACVAKDVPANTPCDDGDACTGHDRCAAGACKGLVNRCQACVGKSAGDPCDDGDACTAETTCVDDGGQLGCFGVETPCGQTKACNLDVCDLASGQCVPVPYPDATPCDDGSRCTLSDQCQAGSCGGPPIGMCGATAPAVCEAPPLLDEPVTNTTLVIPATGGTVTALGFVDAPGAEDWFTLMLHAGDTLSVATHSHCGVALDTTLSVLRIVGTGASGLVTEEVAANDNTPAGAWAQVDGIGVPSDGTYRVRVGSWPSGGATGAYLLTVTVTPKPPCAKDSDCGCPSLHCVAGKCEAVMAAEAEPNDAPKTANPVESFGSAHAAFDVAGDEDWFALPVIGGMPITITTEAFCAGAVDPELTLVDAAGKAIAHDKDGGGFGQARIAHFVSPKSQLVYVRVTDQTSALGPYVLRIVPATCLTDAGCGCADQVCSIVADLPGVCAPALDAAAGSDFTAPAPIAVGDRMHGAIAAPFGQQSFALTLPPGTWEIKTESYCGSVLDTWLAVFNAANEPIDVTDDDTGSVFFAHVSLTLAEAKAVRIDVGSFGASTGEFIVSVQGKAK